jgi:hypothetical protein
MAAPRFQCPVNLCLMDKAVGRLFTRCAREEVNALGFNDLEHSPKIERWFTRIWASEEDESRRFNFSFQMSEAEMRDASHDWAVRLKDVTSKIRSYYMDASRGHLCFACRECEDSSGFRDTDEELIVRHIMEEHPPLPLVKSAIKC